MIKTNPRVLSAVLLARLRALLAAGAEIHWVAVRDLPVSVGLKGTIAGVTGTGS